MCQIKFKTIIKIHPNTLHRRTHMRGKGAESVYIRLPRVSSVLFWLKKFK